MDNTFPIYDRFPQTRGPIGKTVFLFGLTLPLLLFAFSDRPALGAHFQNAQTTQPVVASRFTVADFDGDHRPDLASIETGLDDSGTTSYWIQLELSASARQSIQLSAPAGGLVVQARDVNGDDAVDLVFATAWFNQPVAILLNDGHGRFSRIDPKVFPQAFTQPDSSLHTNSLQILDTTGLVSNLRAGISSQATALNVANPGGRPNSFGHTGRIPKLFFLPHSGRAPPRQRFRA